MRRRRLPLRRWALLGFLALFILCNCPGRPSE